MAIFKCSIFSKELLSNVDVNVIIPTPNSDITFFGDTPEYPKKGEKFQTLYLLHGFSADFSDWARNSGIERYVQNNYLAVVMPSINNSRYCNLPGGQNYYNFYTEELPRIMRSIFPLSDKRENNFIAGLSMGGFGAFKAALTKPENYKAAASLSGGLISRKAGEVNEKRPVTDNKWVKSAYGENNERNDDTKEKLIYILENLVKENKVIPELYISCGTEDFLYDDNIYFRDEGIKLGGKIEYEEASGAHDWDFWDPFIRKVVDWLPLAKRLVD